jgi:hypothetical protein
MSIVPGEAIKGPQDKAQVKCPRDGAIKYRKTTGNNGTHATPGSLRISLSEAVYRAIRTGIEVGRFIPGERMLEVELAEMLDVSRTPVREAGAAPDLGRIADACFSTRCDRHSTGRSKGNLAVYYAGGSGGNCS